LRKVSVSVVCDSLLLVYVCNLASYVDALNVRSKLWALVCAMLILEVWIGSPVNSDLLG